MARRWLAPLAGAVVVLFSIYMWRLLEAQERRQIGRTVQLVAESVRTELSEAMEAHIDALARMAKRWESRGGTPKPEWEADALNYVSHQPGFQAIEWVDPSFHVRWIVPLDGNEAAQDLDLTRVPREHVPDLRISEGDFDERRKIALEQSRDTRRVTVTQSIDLVQGGKGFLVYAPIFEGEKFGGFILGVLQVQNLLDTILEDVAPGYAIAFYDGDEEIFARGVESTSLESRWISETEFALREVAWRLRVWPSEELLHEMQSFVPEAALSAGLLVALLLALTVYAGQQASLNAGRLRVTNLETEGGFSNPLLSRSHGLPWECIRDTRTVVEFQGTGRDIQWGGAA